MEVLVYNKEDYLKPPVYVTAYNIRINLDSLVK